MHDAVRGGVLRYFFRIKGALQEADKRLGAQRVQVRIHAVQALRDRSLTLGRRDVPEVAGSIFHGAGALAVFLIAGLVNQRRACGHCFLADRVGVFDIQVQAMVCSDPGNFCPGIPPPIINMESPMRTSPCTPPLGVLARIFSSAPKAWMAKSSRAGPSSATR